MKDMEKPLVTVVVTGYNQGKFIEEALRSVFTQHYEKVEVILIDNGSSDNTPEIVSYLQTEFPEMRVIRNLSNIGLCKAFNQGLGLAKGQYIVDLAADDVMLPGRIARQVEVFQTLDEEYGVLFSNARYMAENGALLNYHYKVDAEQKAKITVPTGDVYKDILKKYFICTPTMMMRTSILRIMGGYDESLDFEDFDFWVRSGVRWKYFYQDEVLTYKRNVPNSLSTLVSKKENDLLESYYIVCNKAYDLNRDQEEFDLLAGRIRTFIRKCFYAQKFELAIRFRRLLNYIENPDFLTEVIVMFCRLHLPVNNLYRFYLANFQKKRSDREDLAF